MFMGFLLVVMPMNDVRNILLNPVNKFEGHLAHCQVAFLHLYQKEQRLIPFGSHKGTIRKEDEK